MNLVVVEEVSGVTPVYSVLARQYRLMDKGHASEKVHKLVNIHTYIHTHNVEGKTAFLNDLKILPSISATNCLPGIEVAKCLADPCSVELCPANPDATCVANYCGGCNAAFYDRTGQKILNCARKNT